MNRFVSDRPRSPAQAEAEIDRHGLDTKEGFTRFIRQLVDSGEIALSDLPEMFDVSLPTAERWYAGQSAPMPATRRQVLIKLLMHQPD